MKKVDKAWYMFGLKFRDHLEEQEYNGIKAPFTVGFFTVRFPFDLIVFLHSVAFPFPILKRTPIIT